MTAQEDLTGMPTLVRLEQPCAGFSCLHIGPYKIGIAITNEDGEQDPEAAGTALENWVKACNAYTITEALRSALAEARRMCWTAVRLGIDDPAFDPDKHALIQQIDAALSASPAPSTDWRSMDTARKNGRPVLGLFKQTFAPPCGDHAVERWGGTQIVMRHPGLADDGYDCGWNLINGGCGGFPDEWFEGWMPLPLPPDAARTALAGVTAPQEVDAK